MLTSAPVSTRKCSQTATENGRLGLRPASLATTSEWPVCFWRLSTMGSTFVGRLTIFLVVPTQFIGIGRLMCRGRGATRFTLGRESLDEALEVNNPLQAEVVGV